MSLKAIFVCFNFVKISFKILLIALAVAADAQFDRIFSGLLRNPSRSLSRSLPRASSRPSDETPSSQIRQPTRSELNEALSHLRVARSRPISDTIGGRNRFTDLMDSIESSSSIRGGGGRSSGRRSSRVDFGSRLLSLFNSI